LSSSCRGPRSLTATSECYGKLLRHPRRRERSRLMAENLVTRNGTYYVRMQAPKALQELRKSLGKTGTNDVWRSLGTKDRTEAKARFPLVLLEIQQAFEAEKAALLRAVAKPPKPPLVVPDEHALQSAVFHFIRAELHQDEV